ncbi:MAG: tRNA preQ1(34) S-adenosylmethionine ribosyltransferase-isomerase QueA [Candidatus Aenigmarchaeota archaeon]|nr:tRNA preQ1(34) S-adenosylmethionine ribosyltransferase-isomerase QueA [Candidatus Aenigmarchaeota archaeon]
MKLNKFDYHLPKELIAQQPIKPRDHSRLMIVDRQAQTIQHDFFYHLPKYLTSNDILVLNNSKVIPARLIGHKQTGGKAEVLLLRQIDQQNWSALVKQGKNGQKLIFSNQKVDLTAQISKKLDKGAWQVTFNLQGKTLDQAIRRVGIAPTPPYIKQLSNLVDYQTIYAKTDGSVAAPTAGLHFTPELFNRLKKKRIQSQFVTLHVGLGTFQPVREDEIEQHQIHSEWAELTSQVAQRLNQAKQQNKRIISVGTTSTRVLEFFSDQQGKLSPQQNEIDLFIYPGYQFRFIDGLITNFHLPKSTLLMLVMAFAGQKLIKQAYQQAIKHKYRFYSFGDAMLII